MRTAQAPRVHSWASDLFTVTNRVSARARENILQTNGRLADNVKTREMSRSRACYGADGHVSFSRLVRWTAARAPAGAMRAEEQANGLLSAFELHARVWEGVCAGQQQKMGVWGAGAFAAESVVAPGYKA
jgi:hypothetical protein